MNINYTNIQMPQNEQPSSQSEALKQAEQKAIAALASHRNSAIDEQLSVAVARKIPNTSELAQKVRVAEFKLNDVLRKKEYTASQLEKLSVDLKVAMEYFKAQITSVEIDDWEVVQRANLQLAQYQLLAFDEQFRIVGKEKIPVSDELLSDLRNTHYLLELNTKKEDVKPTVEIEALTNKLVALMKRFYAVLEAYDKEDKERDTKKRDIVGRAKIMLRAYEYLRKQDKLSLNAKERNSLSEAKAKQANELFVDTANAVLHLHNRISDENPVALLKAMTNRLENLIQKTSQQVEAIREKNDDEKALDEMDKYFSQ